LLFHLTDALLAPKIDHENMVLIRYPASLETLYDMAYFIRKEDSCLTADRRQTR